MSLNQIIDQFPSNPLVVDKTLNLKAEQIRVHGDVTAGSFNGGTIPSISTTVVPYTVVCYDTITERPVTGTGVTGNITFVKIGSVVTASIPGFNVTAYSGGAASQFLRIKFDTPLPASLVPSLTATAPYTSQTGGVTQTTPGKASLNSSANIGLNSDYFLGSFTVSCGVVNSFQMVYTS